MQHVECCRHETQPKTCTDQSTVICNSHMAAGAQMLVVPASDERCRYCAKGGKGRTTKQVECLQP